MKTDYIDIVAKKGEGYKVKFKVRISGLDREIVAFANASGGSIFLGITDDGAIAGTNFTNAIKSQIQDIACNCDPSIRIELTPWPKHDVLEIKVEEDFDKPYRCKEGFFLRIRFDEGVTLKVMQNLELLSCN